MLIYICAEVALMNDSDAKHLTAIVFVNSIGRLMSHDPDPWQELTLGS